MKKVTKFSGATIGLGLLIAFSAPSAIGLGSGGNAPNIIAGTLYLHEEDLNKPQPVQIAVIRNGKRISTLPYNVFAASRGVSATWIGGRVSHQGTMLHYSFNNRESTLLSPCPEETTELAISSSGRMAACVSAGGVAALFSMGRVASHVVRLPIKADIDWVSGINFLPGDTLAVLKEDGNCPFPKGEELGTGARLVLFDMKGNVRKVGACSAGVVAGQKRVAYIRLGAGGLPEYTEDGKRWLPGDPMAFDGKDMLLLGDSHYNLITEHGQLIASKVPEAWWGP
jgi:hypothetical protein